MGGGVEAAGRVGVLGRQERVHQELRLGGYAVGDQGGADGAAFDQDVLLFGQRESGSPSSNRSEFDVLAFMNAASNRKRMTSASLSASCSLPRI